MAMMVVSFLTSKHWGWSNQMRSLKLKLFLIGAVAMLTGNSHGVHANSQSSLEVTLDKGSIELAIGAAHGNEPYSFSYKMPDGCGAQLQVRRSAGKLDLTHSERVCSEGVKVVLKVRPDVTLKVQVGAGLVNLIDAETALSGRGSVAVQAWVGTVNAATIPNSTVVRINNYSGA